MSTVVTGLFDDDRAARNAAEALEAAGINADDIGIISGNADERWNPHFLPAADAAGAGASIGGVVGGGVGLLAGLGLFAIPGLGPVVAAGWLASTAAGAVAGGAAGGVIGALVSLGMSSDHAEVYAESIKRGGTLVALRVADALASEAKATLRRHGALDPDKRLANYRAAGWTRFDEGSAPSEPPVRYTDMLRH